MPAANHKKAKEKNPYCIEVTPEMIAAGRVFLENEALGCFSQRAVSAEFALEFYLAMEIERLKSVLEWSNDDPSASSNHQPKAPPSQPPKPPPSKND